MILADKIILLRKKSGWSQEELASQLNVSRQSVSKWEGAQSIPDMEKILLMSKIFGVSTDYLLKDSIEEEEPIKVDGNSSLRIVTMEDANTYLALQDRTSKKISLGVFLCIISPVALILLAGTQEYGPFTFSENIAAGVGLVVLFLLVASGVGLFILSHSAAEPYEYLERESFETEYGVDGMLRQRQLELRENHTYFLTFGIILCILSVIPVCALALFTGSDMGAIVGVALMLLIAGAGVLMIVRTSIQWGAIKVLLQEGDYAVSKKKKNSVAEAFERIYWCIVLASYLGYSFVTQDWSRSWIIWPVAAVLNGVIDAFLDIPEKK